MMQRTMVGVILAATSATFAGIPECPLQQTAKLTADDGASGDYFGYSVATSGGVAVDLFDGSVVDIRGST